MGSIIFGLFSMVFMLVIFLAVVFFAIFMARKIGLLNVPEEGAEGTGAVAGFKSYLSTLKNISNSLIFKFGIIAVLVGMMTIPQDMVNQIVRERSHLYDSAIHNIANSWGQRQELKGPAMLVPYTEKFNSVVYKTDSNGIERKVDKVRYEKRTAIILPDDLKIDVNINGEKRKVSLYEALVYSADLDISGSFHRPDLYKLSDHIDQIHWDRAWFALGISDTQAINKVSSLHWDLDKTPSSIDFEPGTAVVKTLPSGFHAGVPLGPTAKADAASQAGPGADSGIASNTPKDKVEKRIYRFALTLNVNGSDGFYFTPFGKTTDVKISSDWPHPSFQGSVLPESHDISADGFTATWSVPHLARSYPQIWTLETQKFNTTNFKAGVNLFETVSHYSQVTRAIKYGVLFLSLTYITFLIFELGINRRLHVVQYAMIGLALSMFYLVLLSMTEHTAFFKAYISAAAIIITMISLYAYAAIRSYSRTLLISALLVGLYSMLYSLLKLEDYALLAGTALLLVILGVLMYLTRNIGKDKDDGGQASSANFEKEQQLEKRLLN
jgi:inner membrane protein